MPDTWGKAPMASGVVQVAASRASRSWAPVTSMVATVLPKGKTASRLFLEMSPLARASRMPPPLVSAASTFSSPRVWRACHRMASAAKSPRLVSVVRTPLPSGKVISALVTGSVAAPPEREPFRSTSVVAIFSP